ncbi:MAG: type VI secretion system tip protein VgrG [Acidobacteriota bacterium]
MSRQMIAKYTQDNRKIAIYTPLPKDKLLLQGFTGQEGISRLFHFDLRLHSEDRSIDFNSIIGKQATIKIVLGDNKTERYLNGLICSFSQGGASHIFTYYQAALVPWVWMLTRTTNCRIFQNMTAPDIIQKILEEHIKRIIKSDFARFRLSLHGRYKEREYCVQYRETDFNFISRLMEEEGIFYFFEHEEKNHTMVLADHYNDFQICKHQPKIRYELAGGERRSDEVITEWSIGQEVRSGRYAMNDFNFKQPLLDLTTNITGKDERKFEIYDYPGEYFNKDEGERLIGIRMEEEDIEQVLISGSSTSRGFISGSRFKLERHYRNDLNQEYVLTAIHHSADQGTNYCSSEADAIGNFDYRNHFQCIPYPRQFRPARTTPVPVVHGTQTAMVVGPADEEIHVDEFGRVRVQFHWDREGQYNEQSSCWIRVAQNWAGKRWGSMFIPRIGQEVIVDFLEGDPDRPIIIGRVYNGNSMPPYELPTEKTKSTIKSLSSKGGNGFNEIRFEDLKGSEQIFIHAEKNEDVRIKNDRYELVANNSHLIVGNEQFEKVDRDKHLKVKYNQNEEVGGTVSLTAGGDLQRKVGMKYALDADQEIHLKAGINVVIEAGISITLKAGGNFINIGPGGIFINGLMVYINSGGAAGSGSGAHPAGPKLPKEADTGQPGEKSELPPPKRTREVSSYSPGAMILKRAAQDGLPFCEV